MAILQVRILKFLRAVGLIGRSDFGWLFFMWLAFSTVSFGTNWIFRKIFIGHSTLWHEMVFWILLVMPFLGFGIFVLGYLSTLERRVRTLAHTDWLTGVSNRRHFMDELETRRHDGQAGLLLYVDADYFKTINDRYGHDVGNEGLYALARHLESFLREGDLLGRIGGEEFALFLADLDTSQLAAIGPALCNGVILDHIPEAPQITCSAGAFQIDPTLPRCILLKNADMALSAAKADGRARIVVFENERPQLIATAPPPATENIAFRSSSAPRPRCLDQESNQTLVARFLNWTGLIRRYSPAKHILVFLVFLAILYLSEVTLRMMLFGDVHYLGQLAVDIANGAPVILMFQTANAHMVDLRDELHRQAHRDPLTNLLNRRGFFSEVDRNIPGTLILIDADFFKSVNDRFGHDRGDECLVMIADHIQSQFRATDIVGRLGGEEFGVFLPNTQSLHAAQLGRRLCSGVALPITESHTHQVTLSAGLTEIGDLHSLDTALTTADQALYQAKRDGRARMELGLFAA